MYYYYITLLCTYITQYNKIHGQNTPEVFRHGKWKHFWLLNQNLVLCFQSKAIFPMVKIITDTHIVRKDFKTIYIVVFIFHISV